MTGRGCERGGRPWPAPFLAHLKPQCASGAFRPAPFSTRCFYLQPSALLGHASRRHLLLGTSSASQRGLRNLPFGGHHLAVLQLDLLAILCDLSLFVGSQVFHFRCLGDPLDFEEVIPLFDKALLQNQCARRLRLLLGRLLTGLLLTRLLHLLLARLLGSTRLCRYERSGGRKGCNRAVNCFPFHSVVVSNRKLVAAMRASASKCVGYSSHKQGSFWADLLPLRDSQKWDRHCTAWYTGELVVGLSERVECFRPLPHPLSPFGEVDPSLKEDEDDDDKEEDEQMKGKDEDEQN